MVVSTGKGFFRRFKGEGGRTGRGNGFFSACFGDCFTDFLLLSMAPHSQQISRNESGDSCCNLTKYKRRSRTFLRSFEPGFPNKTSRPRHSCQKSLPLGVRMNWMRALSTSGETDVEYRRLRRLLGDDTEKSSSESESVLEKSKELLILAAILIVRLRAVPRVIPQVCQLQDSIELQRAR
jgi:hypothetical protein